MEDYITDEELYKRGEEVFNWLENFNKRLNSEIIRLDKNAPITFLCTNSWRKEIYDLLKNIEYGNLA